MKNNQELLGSTLFYGGKIGSIENHAVVRVQMSIVWNNFIGIVSLCAIFVKLWENFIDSLQFTTYNCLFLC